MLIKLEYPSLMSLKGVYLYLFLSRVVQYSFSNKVY